MPSLQERGDEDIQVLLLLATIITIRGRKALTWLHYIDTVCKYSKMANCLLFYREQSFVSLIFYAMLCLLHFLFFPPNNFPFPPSFDTKRKSGLIFSSNC